MLRLDVFPVPLEARVVTTREISIKNLNTGTFAVGSGTAGSLSLSSVAYLFSLPLHGRWLIICHNMRYNGTGRDVIALSFPCSFLFLFRVMFSLALSLYLSLG